MKKIIIGMFLGIILLYLFIYFGGADYLKIFGKKTEQAGEGLKQYEKNVKDTTKSIKRTIKDAEEKIKERLP